MKKASSGERAVFYVLTFFLFFSCTEPGYYVSNSGDDQNPGTKKKPFRSIAKINTLILEPGDRVLFKGGETFEGTLSLSLQGAKNDSILISTYDGGQASIHGGDKEAIVIRGSYFSLRNLHTAGSGRKTGNTTNGISLMECSHATVENIRTEGFQKSGLDLYNCEHVEVRNVTAQNNGFGGINVGGKDRTKSRNILLQNCNAENNPGDPTNLDNHSGNGILVGQSDSVVVDHCVATNNGWDMPRVGNGPVGIWAYESSHIIIQYCISYGNKTAKGAKDGGGFDLDGGVTHSIIQYCLSYNNEGAGYGLFQYWGASLWHDNIVRYCVSVNDATTTEGSGGIFTWNGSPDTVQLANCIVHNNLIYTTLAPAIKFEPASLNKNFRFYNNIIIGSGEIVSGPSSGEKFLGNIWWNAPGRNITFRNHGKLFTWANLTGQEKLQGEIRGKQIDPLLKGPLTATLTDPYELHTLLGFTLLADSPLKNSGLNIDSLFKVPATLQDFYGTHLPQGSRPEPGIYEFEEN